MTGRTDDVGAGVIALDGTDETLSAVRFAAEQAQRHHVSLHLAHVMPAMMPIGPMVMVATEDGMAGFASEAMSKALAVVAEVAPEVEATPHILLGGRVSQIIALAENARFVVMGRRATTGLDRFWSGGTLDGITARARVPAFVVPANQGPADQHTTTVVAGYKRPAHAAELFEAAFSAADELDAHIRVLHAWRLSSEYDDVIARRVGGAGWSCDQEDAIHNELARWREAYPRIPVEVQVHHEHPIRTLVEASRQADRLVLVKPFHGSAVHHLGHTARGVLRRAECPVEVVPAKSPGELTLTPVDLEAQGGLIS